MKPGSLKYKTPITYYGGKQRIARGIITLIPAHKVYCEPFFGGGAVFFQKQPSYLEVINDLNEMLVNFYIQCQNNFEILAARISNTLHSESMHRKALQIYNGVRLADDIERAVATWLVFNQSWNASARAGWKFDMGYGGSHAGIVQHHFRDYFCPWLKKRLANVQISCRDALLCIKDRDSEDTFFYLDPPYPDTNQGHYSGYTMENLEELLTLLETIKGHFMLSNYPSPMISKFAVRNNWPLHSFHLKKDSTLPRNPSSTKTEIILMNYKISVPHQAEIFEKIDI